MVDTLAKGLLDLAAIDARQDIANAYSENDREQFNSIQYLFFKNHPLQYSILLQLISKRLYAIKHNTCLTRHNTIQKITHNIFIQHHQNINKQQLQTKYTIINNH